MQCVKFLKAKKRTHLIHSLYFHNDLNLFFIEVLKYLEIYFFDLYLNSRIKYLLRHASFYDELKHRTSVNICALKKHELWICDPLPYC